MIAQTQDFQLVPFTRANQVRRMKQPQNPNPNREHGKLFRMGANFFPGGKNFCSAENTFDNFLSVRKIFLRKNFRTEKTFFPRKENRRKAVCNYVWRSNGISVRKKYLFRGKLFWWFSSAWKIFLRKKFRTEEHFVPRKKSLANSLKLRFSDLSTNLNTARRGWRFATASEEFSAGFRRTKDGRSSVKGPRRKIQSQGAKANHKLKHACHLRFDRR